MSNCSSVQFRRSEGRKIHLSHWGGVTHKCIGNLTSIGSDNGLSLGRPPSHYLNQCCNIVNWTLWSKLQRNFNRNSNSFIQENVFQGIVCEMEAILSRIFTHLAPVVTIWCHRSSSLVDQVMAPSHDMPDYRSSGLFQLNCINYHTYIETSLFLLITTPPGIGV